MIGYYAHHVGVGHVQRAAAIARASRQTVVGFSSRPIPSGWLGRWIQLPDDQISGDPEAADVTAGGALHWVPRLHDGLRIRMDTLAKELGQGDIRLMVVDVSVEVALLARLFGVPVIVVAQPGTRTDRPHRLAYDLADRLLAAWPKQSELQWPPNWVEKTIYLGALSRFDGLHVPLSAVSARRVVALWGSGGIDIGADDLRAAARATPDWHWHVLGPGGPSDAGPPNLNWLGWVDDVWSELIAAEVVVTHAGQNAVAEVAAARRPAIVVPQERPHGEQFATAATLRRLGIGTVVSTWPESGDWPQLLHRASGQGGDSWSRWSLGDGAVRAAALLDDLADPGR